jgi:hypothetical protein
MHSGEYDACDVTLSVYPHRASLKNMPDHRGQAYFSNIFMLIYEMYMHACYIIDHICIKNL